MRMFFQFLNIISRQSDNRMDSRFCKFYYAENLQAQNNAKSDFSNIAQPYYIGNTPCK